MPVRYVNKDTYNNLRPRIEKDVYETPYPLANTIVDYMTKNYQFDIVNGGIQTLDPGAGSGVFGKALQNAITNFYTVGVELRDLIPPKLVYNEYYETDDYLQEIEYGWRKEFQLIIGNPPFKYAEKFIWQSKEYISKGGYICFLLPSAFQHTVKRGRGLFTEYKPDRIVSLMQRPNFTGPLGESLGKANTDDYILGIWKSYSSNVTYHDWLDWKNND